MTTIGRYFVGFGMRGLILCICLLFSLDIFAAKVLKLHDIKKVISYANNLKKDALVVFAVEDVLYYPQDQILQTAHKPKMYQLSMHLQNFYPVKEADEMLSIQMQTRKPPLVDPALIEVITELKQKHVKAIAITNGWSGSLGHIASLEDWQVQDLASLGIDLSWSFNNRLPVLLEDYVTADPKRFPSFRGGIVFACHMAQGEVLDALFTRLKWRPSELLFVGALKRHVDSVMHFCQSRNIAFTGFVYDGVHQLTAQTLDLPRAALQYSVLGYEKKWLNDSEASQLLKVIKQNTTR